MADSENTTPLPGPLPNNTPDRPPGTSTTIPELGITFANALAKGRDLREAERNAIGRGDHDDADAVNLEYGRLSASMLAAEPSTPADALALLEVLADPECGLAAGRAQNDALAIQRAFAILSHKSAMFMGCGAALHTSVIPSLNMTFRQAADRVRELLKWNEASADRDVRDDGEEGEQLDANFHELDRFDDTILSTPAQTIGDVLAKLERLACPHLGAGVFEVEPEQIYAIAADLHRIGASGIVGVAHADAELIDTTACWFSMIDGFDSMEDDPTPEQWAEARRLHDRITALPTRTVAGALAKVAALTSHIFGCIAGLEEGDQLYPLLSSIEATKEAEAVAQFARRIVEHLQEIDRGSLHAEKTITVLRTGRPRPERDGFSAAVAAFQGAVPAGLCMPATPTDAMVQAGASAGGIDLEQARAIYTAMAGAYRQEAA